MSTPLNPRDVRARYDKANTKAIVAIDRDVFASLQDILVLLKLTKTQAQAILELETELKNAYGRHK